MFVFRFIQLILPPTLNFQSCIAVNARVKGCRMGRSDKVSLWYVALLI